MENVEQKNREQFQMFCFAVEDTSSEMCLLNLMGMSGESRKCMEKILKHYGNKYGQEHNRTTKLRKEIQEMFEEKDLYS